MYVNGKMMSVEIIPGMGSKEVKENGGGDEFNMIYLMYCNNFCKWYNVFLPRTIKK
jgi:hypothetical protein